VAFLVLLGVFAALIGFLVIANRRRTGALERLASDRGWSYERRDVAEIAEKYSRFPLFRQGQEGVANDLMRFQRDGRDVEVFGYRYGWRGVRRSVFVHQTVVHVVDPRMDLPAFTMRGPDTVRNSFERWGLGNVFFERAPAFSDRNYVDAADPAATAARFDGAVLALLGSRERVSLDAAGPHLFYFRRNEVVKVSDIPARVEEALELADAFARRPPPPTPPPLG
jgi:hypothetical protein